MSFLSSKSYFEKVYDRGPSTRGGRGGGGMGGGRGICVCVCVSVCVCLSLASDSAETIKVIRVTAGLRHENAYQVFIILTLTFIQGYTDLNHENNKCSIINNRFKHPRLTEAGPKLLSGLRHAQWAAKHILLRPPPHTRRGISKWNIGKHKKCEQHRPSDVRSFSTVVHLCRSIHVCTY